MTKPHTTPATSPAHRTPSAAARSNSNPAKPDEDPLVFDANMSHALRRYYRRTREGMVSTEMPFDELLRNEREPGETVLEAEDPDEAMRIRVAAIRTLFRYFLAEGPEPLKIMKRLFAVGRGLDIAPFSALTMTEAAKLFGEGKAAHSWRVKFLSGLIKLNGMHGSRLPGQKAETPAYSAAQQGNKNRKNGKRRNLRPE